MSDSSSPTLAATQSQRPPFYRDAVVVKWLTQVATLVLVLGALFFLTTRAGQELEAKNIPTGFDFLEVDPGIDLSEGIDTNPDTGGRALWVGMVNTIRLAIGGIMAATALGVVVGVGRLSKNWIVSKLSSLYIEMVRNVPLLVQIFLIFAVMTALPRAVEDQGPIPGWLHLSNKGLSVPRVFVGDGFYQWLIFLGAGLVAGRYASRWRHRVQDLSGRDANPGLWFLGVVVAFGLAGWWLHPVFGWLRPVFAAVADAIGAVPPEAVQALLSLGALAAAGWWIKRFVDSHRTPAGLAKLTDDDYFRMIFAAVGAVLVIVVVFVVWPGLASWLVNSGRDLFEVVSDKFGGGRTGPPIDGMRPDIEKLGNFPNYGPAGLNFTLAMAAIYFGVVLYTAAFIAEIVRGGILAVPRGQTEAAQALGLRRVTMLRRVILPQTFRIILPPLGNQYLNLTKNTSLAIAVGYSDLAQVGQTLFSQTGKSIEIFSIWMLFYLACSLTISAVVNWFNVRLRLVER